MRFTVFCVDIRGSLNGKYSIMDSRAVSGVIQRGGTILQSARCEEFKTEAGQLKAVSNLFGLGVEGMVVIGGDGSLRGANVLAGMGMPVIGIPASIDNDIFGTRYLYRRRYRIECDSWRS